MSLPSFASQTVTVKRAGLINDHGTQVSDWDSSDDHDLTGVVIVPGPGQESQINRDAVTTVWTVFAELGADVLDSDRIIVDGTDYDINGSILRYATGVLDHLEIPLKAVAG